MAPQFASWFGGECATRSLEQGSFFQGSDLQTIACGLLPTSMESGCCRRSERALHTRPVSGKHPSGLVQPKNPPPFDGKKFILDLAADLAEHLDAFTGFKLRF
jgi:hypothetical protein